MAALLLAVSLLAFRYFTRGALFGRGRLPPPATRRAYLARLVWRPLVLFGGGGVALLAPADALDLAGAVPPELAPARAYLVAHGGDGLPLAPLAWAMAAGALLGVGIARWSGRRLEGTFGDTRAIRPRDAGELPWAAAMALSAGVSEELFFRLAVPLLAARATGSAWAGLALGTALFGLAHRYQRWRGVVATGMVGALLAAGFLVADSLWVAIALHVALDFNALVLRPVLMGRVRVLQHQRARR